MEKSVILLTNFWDAQACIKQKFLLYPQEDKIYKINIDYSEGPDKNKTPINYFIHSIALSHPDFKSLPDLKIMTRLDVFCPTYEMLSRYKEDSNWDNYTLDYINLLRNRKARMSEWINSIAEGKVYFLCCWENTAGKAHCHREIVYKAMINSKIVMEKAIVIYRKGNEIKKQVLNNQNQLVISEDLLPSSALIFGPPAVPPVVIPRRSVAPYSRGANNRRNTRFNEDF